MNRLDNFENNLVAANNGNATAILFVAECYADGVQAPKDLRLAARWFEKAAKNGVSDGMYEIARCYIIGMDVPQHLERAKLWLKKAYKTDRLISASSKASSRRRDQVMGLIMNIGPKH